MFRRPNTGHHRRRGGGSMSEVVCTSDLHVRRCAQECDLPACPDPCSRPVSVSEVACTAVRSRLPERSFVARVRSRGRRWNVLRMAPSPDISPDGVYGTPEQASQLAPWSAAVVSGEGSAYGTTGHRPPEHPDGGMGARRAWPASGGPGRCGTARDRIGALEVLARHGSHGVSAAEPAGRMPWDSRLPPRATSPAARVPAPT